MKPIALALVVMLAACGGGSGDGPSGDAADDGDGPGADGGMPEAICARPAVMPITNPTTMIGDGTAASCTEAALRTAAATGGTIAFNCGSAPMTIAVTAALTVTAETVIDGGGLVTLDGSDTTRILLLDSGYDTVTPTLTVQRLGFVRGKGPTTGDDTARGGGAIYRDGGSLVVIDCTFKNNHAGATGQDLAGGAIYGFGGGSTTIIGSTFDGNSASDGGAVGNLNSDLVIIDSSFTHNQATGSDGNPGNGGCGGALYQDGRDEQTSLCGVTIRGNTAGAIGGGVFRVSNDNTGTFAMARSSVDDNHTTPSDGGNAGGLYLQGLAITIDASTISRNQGFYNGGLWISTSHVEMTNTTIAENIATGSNGGGLWLGHDPTGTLTNVTIANNHSTADGQIAGAIFGDGLTLVNTIVAGNSAMYTPSCNQTRTDGAGNLQFPGSAPCTTAPTIADPLLGALGDQGGPTEVLVPAAGSPAIGLGVAACPPTDQLGHPRPLPCTAGAVEPL